MSVLGVFIAQYALSVGDDPLSEVMSRGVV